MKSFSDRLYDAIRQKGTPVLVGLDPRWNMLPAVLVQGNEQATWAQKTAVFESFCRTVIDIVAPLVPAVKPQAAFFEQCGPEGMLSLGRVIQYATSKGLLVILDGKRNDIGSTAAAYAAGMLGQESPWGADALTVSPYLGDDSLTPFVDVAGERGAGVFILVKTSNPGGAMLQDKIAEGIPVYRHVAEFVHSLAEKSWEQTQGKSPYGSIGAVVGATWPAQLTELRQVMKRTWFLVPGYGSQGGGAADVAGAFDEDGLGAIVNNSRGIIFAWRSPKYAESFGEKQWERAIEQSTRDMIADLAAQTLAGRLKKGPR